MVLGGGRPWFREIRTLPEVEITRRHLSRVPDKIETVNKPKAAWARRRRFALSCRALWAMLLLTEKAK